MEDIEDKELVEDKNDIPNSGRDSSNMDARYPNMDRKAMVLGTPNTDKNIPNMDMDIYMGSRVDKDSNQDKGNEDKGNEDKGENNMWEDAHNLGKRALVPALGCLPPVKLKA